MDDLMAVTEAGTGLVTSAGLGLPVCSLFDKIAVAVFVALIAAAIVLKGCGLVERRRQPPEEASDDWRASGIRGDGVRLGELVPGVNERLVGSGLSPALPEGSTASGDEVDELSDPVAGADSDVAG